MFRAILGLGTTCVVVVTLGVLSENRLVFFLFPNMAVREKEWSLQRRRPTKSVQRVGEGPE